MVNIHLIFKSKVDKLFKNKKNEKSFENWSNFNVNNQAGENIFQK